MWGHQIQQVAGQQLGLEGLLKHRSWVQTICTRTKMWSPPPFQVQWKTNYLHEQLQFPAIKEMNLAKTALGHLEEIRPHETCQLKQVKHCLHFYLCFSTSAVLQLFYPRGKMADSPPPHFLCVSVTLTHLTVMFFLCAEWIGKESHQADVHMGLTQKDQSHCKAVFFILCLEKKKIQQRYFNHKLSLYNCTVNYKQRVSGPFVIRVHIHYCLFHPHILPLHQHHSPSTFKIPEMSPSYFLSPAKPPN